MGAPAATASWIAQLCQPYEGARFLHGRAWPAAPAGCGAGSGGGWRGGAPLSVYVSQQTEQHDCMIADGSQLQYDVGLIDHALGRELRVDGVVKSGGSLIALGAVPGGEAGDARLTFAPDTLHMDSDAARLAGRLFPELLASMASRGVDASELLLVQGTLAVTARGPGGVDALWRPLSTGQSSGGAGGGDSSSTSSGSAVPPSTAEAAAGASSSAAAPSSPPPPPLPGTVAELLARNWEGTNVHVHPGMTAGEDGDVDTVSAGGSDYGDHSACGHSHAHGNGGSATASSTAGAVPQARVTDDVQLLPPSSSQARGGGGSSSAAAASASGAGGGGGGGGTKRAAVDADGWITTKRTAARLAGGGGGGST